MASELDIWNLALVLLRKKPIKNPDASSPEATTMRAVYPLAFDFLLREYPWSFCSKVESLALTELSSPLYTYVYQYPLDCVKATQLVSPDNINKEQDYEIATSNKTKVILSNVSNAVLRYTTRETITNDIDATFIVALAARLAADAAISLTGRTEIWEACERRYMDLIEKAKVADARECKRTAKETSSIADSRF